jgi:hypothetical protein
MCLGKGEWARGGAGELARLNAGELGLEGIEVALRDL